MASSGIIQGRTNRIMSLSLNRPVRTMLVLFLVAVLIKVLDTFILRLDEALGEAILTKSMGLVLVVAFVWACGRRMSDIGFHRNGVGRALLIGGGGTAALMALAYGIQWAVLRADGQQATLTLTAVDPKSGMSGGFMFGLWLFLTNLVNSAMEEGLFRGLMIKHFRIRYRPWNALLLQALIFAIWHLNWPVKNLLWNGTTAGEAVSQALFLIAGTFVSGLFTGYIYLKTNNLWGAFLAHTINNTVLNMLFISTATGAQPPTDFMVLMAIYTSGLVLLIPVIGWWAKRLGLPEVAPWGAD